MSKNSPQIEKILKDIKLLKKITKKYHKISNINKNKLSYYTIVKKKKLQLKKILKLFDQTRNWITKNQIFFIKKYKNKFNCKLNFFKKINIHPIFYIF